MVPEGDAEDREVDKDTYTSCLPTTYSIPLPPSTFTSLDMCGSLGLLPRPGRGFHFTLDNSFNNNNNQAQYSPPRYVTGLHLDQVPFIVRSAKTDDAAAIYQLQAYVSPSLLLQRVSLAHLQRRLELRHPWQWVVEVKCCVVAVILLVETKNQGCLMYQMAAVHPALEERAEVLCALCHFAIHQLLADPSVLQLQQGNLRLREGGPEEILLSFDTSGELSEHDVSDRNCFGDLHHPVLQGSTDKPGSPSRVDSSTCNNYAQRKINLFRSFSIDHIISTISGASKMLSLPLADDDIESSIDADRGEPSPGLSQALLGMRTKAGSIAEEARRLTQQLNLTGEGPNYYGVVIVV